MPAASSGLLGAAEVAEYLDVHLRTAQLWLAAGEIPSTFVDGARRVRQEDLEAWLEGRRVRPGAERPCLGRRTEAGDCCT